MKDFFIKISFFTYIALFCLCIACGAAGCGNPFCSTGKNRQERHEIDETLFWQTNSGLIYKPCAKEETEKENVIGYIACGGVYEKGVIKGQENTPSNEAGETKDGEEFCGSVEVYKYDYKEEEFFPRLEKRLYEWQTIYSYTRIGCVIDGDTALTQLVRLDLGRMVHFLYLQQGDALYCLKGKMQPSAWQDFLDRLLLDAKLCWNDRLVRTTNNPVYGNFEGNGQVLKKVRFGDMLFPVNHDLVSCTFFENGVKLQFDISGEGEETLVEEISVSLLEELPEYGTEEEMLQYFLERYPSLREYCVYPEEIHWAEKECRGKKFRIMIDEKASYGVFWREGKTYLVTSDNVSIYPYEIHRFRSNLGYSYMYIFQYRNGEDNLAYIADTLGDKYCREICIGEEKITLRTEKILETESDWVEEICRVSVYREGEEEPFQMMEETSAQWGDPISIEDFNADGYPDITIMDYYGSNGGTASHYLWSPLKQRFVRADPELDYFGNYWVDSESRQLYMHYHGSAVAGTELTFQWFNETDYKIVKSFEHDTVDDWKRVSVKISRYDNGREEILSDYVYSMDEYYERIGDIFGIYWEDFVWEKEIRDADTGKKYMLRYAQTEEEEGWGGRLYVFSEDTYLIRVLPSEAALPYSSIAWKDENDDGEKELVIIFAEGTDLEAKAEYSLCELTESEYEP